MKIEEESPLEFDMEGNPVEKHEKFLLKRKNTERDEFPKMPSLIQDQDELLEKEALDEFEFN